MKKTLIDLLERSVALYGDNTFLLEKKTDRFEPTTYKQAQARAIEIGAGLASLGVAKGDNKETMCRFLPKGATIG